MSRTNTPAADALIDRYFPVLDHGFIALKDYMGGDQTVENFARTSYKIGDENRTVEQTRNLIRYLLRSRHSSPFESTELTFHVGMPIFVARQWIRHRMSSTNEFSGRYSEIPMIFYEPGRDQVCYQATDNKQGRSGPVDEDTYLRFVGDLDARRGDAKDSYRWAVDKGVAKETSRIDLPLSTYTYMYWKIDLHNLFHFLGLRCDPHAQWEIRQYADVMAGIVKAVAPICFEAFEDYKFGAVTFSRMEMDYLRGVIARYEDLYDKDPESYRTDLSEFGVVGKREQDEFLKKIGQKDPKSFDLDVDAAKDGKFFFDKVRDNL